jgi:hypothetical protein
MKPDCASCANSYDGVDCLRCRNDGLVCSPVLALLCGKFAYEPGTDANELDTVICKLFKREIVWKPI